MTNKERVLIGDDDMATRYLAKRAVRPYEVHEALTAEDLVEKARQAIESRNPYLMIVSDHNYNSGFDGIEAIRRIRAFDKGTPIFWHSGAVDELDSDKDPLVILALEAGATHARFKNANMKSITRALNEHKLRQEAQAK